LPPASPGWARHGRAEAGGTADGLYAVRPGVAAGLHGVQYGHPTLHSTSSERRSAVGGSVRRDRLAVGLLGPPSTRGAPPCQTVAHGGPAAGNLNFFAHCQPNGLHFLRTRSTASSATAKRTRFRGLTSPAGPPPDSREPERPVGAPGRALLSGLHDPAGRLIARLNGHRTC